VPALGSIRTTRPSLASATQIAPSPTAIAFASGGIPAAVTGRTSFELGSTCCTEELPPEADPKPVVSQTAPSPVATPVGVPFVDFTVTTLPDAGSIRCTVPSPALITQIAPSPAAMPSGDVPTGMSFE